MHCTRWQIAAGGQSSGGEAVGGLAGGRDEGGGGPEGGGLGEVAGAVVEQAAGGQ
jgi:hypothetical protein